MTVIERTFLAAAAATSALTLAACGSMGGGDGGYSPRLATKASDEKAFASTFASCRDEVRAGKTSGFKVHPASATARDLPPGPTGLVLKVPYDKAKGSKSQRAAYDERHKAAVAQCLSENGYQVAAWDAVKP
ncbi:hypothetical protein [Caulobacter hibisci]|uniref:Lipoprotein n=1 Tax=Caulobacter hibisci TaxID=2035993 RepID=A0ABS0T3N4_9CAUL|nr:hypothetical protein [Caulobacter hibisci]MBI1686376.1 hypothetical protein [Caulobacter hibisci]